MASLETQNHGQQWHLSAMQTPSNCVGSEKLQYCVLSPQNVVDVGLNVNDIINIFARYEAMFICPRQILWCGMVSMLSV